MFATFCLVFVHVLIIICNKESGLCKCVEFWKFLSTHVWIHMRTRIWIVAACSQGNEGRARERCIICRTHLHVCLHGIVAGAFRGVAFYPKIVSRPQQQKYRENDKKDAQQIQKNHGIIVFGMLLAVNGDVDINGLTDGRRQFLVQKRLFQ